MNSLPTQIFCVCCKEIRWATTHSLKTVGPIQIYSHPDMYPVTICLDCEEDVLARLTKYINNDIPDGS